jgi:hypothetical protein
MILCVIVFFCHVSTYLLSDKLSQKIIPYILKKESKNEMKWFYSVNILVADMQHNSSLHYMFHVALEPTEWYGSSSLNDYQFESKEILPIPTLLHIYNYIQWSSV